MIHLTRILYPTDFSAHSLHALPYARSFAEEYKAELHCLYVVDEAYQYWMGMSGEGLPISPSPEELVLASQQQMKTFLEKNLAGCSVPIVSRVVGGRPFVEIIQYAREAKISLIVIATHGRGALQQVLLGGTAEKVVRKAPCPVLTVRHPEHEFAMP